MSYLSHLEYPECDHTYPADELNTICAPCVSPLLARCDWDWAKFELDRDAFRLEGKKTMGYKNALDFG